MSQVECEITKGCEEDLCPGWGEKLSLLNLDGKSIQVKHGGDAGVGSTSRHRPKKSANPIGEKHGLHLDPMSFDVGRLEHLLRICVLSPVCSSLLVTVRSRKGSADAINGFVDEGKFVPRQKINARDKRHLFVNKLAQITDERAAHTP